MLMLYLATIDDSDDRDKFEYLYTRFYSYMLYAADNIVHNKFDAEDIVHDTFVDIAKNIKLIRTAKESETLSYLICATRGHAYNFINRKYHKNLSIDEMSNFLTYDEWANIESELDYHQLIKIIQNINKLYSDVLYLHYVKGLKCREIGLLLGRSENAVKKQLQRGRNLLAQELKQGGYLNDKS